MTPIAGAIAPNMSFVPQTGEIADLLTSIDWSTSSLGDPDTWPQSLKTTLSILLTSRFPTCLFWGEELIFFYNDAFRGTLGVDGKHPRALGSKGCEVWNEIWPTIKPWIDQVLNRGEAIWLENELVPFYRNGTIEEIYWTFCYNAVYGESNKPNGVFVTCTETTRIKKLEDSERNFRDLVLQAPVGICIVKRDPVVVEVVNDLFLNLVGRKRNELEGHRLWEALHETKEHYEPIMQNVFETGKAYTGSEHKVVLFRSGKEETVYVNFVYEPMRDEMNAIKRIMILAIEVTGQVIARKEIEKAQLREKLAINVSQLGVFEVDLKTNTVIASKRLEEIFDVKDTSERSRFVEAIHPDDMAQRAEAYKRAYRTGILQYEARILRKDGTIRWMRSRGTILFDESRQPIKLVGVTQDITEEKKFEEELNKMVLQRTTELQNKNAELLRSNQRLEEFAHAASHDLKEPIRKIYFFIDRLKSQLEGRLREEESTTFDKIESSTQRMVGLIDDMLLYTSASQTFLEKELVDLYAVVELVLDDLEIDILAKNASVKVNPLPKVMGYRRQFQQLFQNLISNSIKYAKSDQNPQIEISSRRVSGMEYQSLVNEEPGYSYYDLIEIADNGIGFDPKYSEQIFRVFQRLHEKNKYGGTGIGLAIARRVVDNHNGKITAVSSEGKGATFRIFLPVE